MPDSPEKERLTPTRTELVWPGKRTQVERLALPFQVVFRSCQGKTALEQRMGFVT